MCHGQSGVWLGELISATCAKQLKCRKVSVATLIKCIQDLVLANRLCCT